MNNVSLIGRLTAAPEMKTTQTGTEYVKFSIAVDRPVKKGEEKQTDFINIVAWSKTAAFVCKYFTRGQRIAVTGSIRTGSYKDRDGNKRYTTDVWAEKVYFCETKRENTSSAPAEGGNDIPDIIDAPDLSDKDLPF